MVLGIGLAGSGLLIFYYFGAMNTLHKQGFLEPGKTPLGGLSGGAITAMQTCAEVPFKQQLSGFQKVVSACQTNYPGDPLCGGTSGARAQQSVLNNLQKHGRGRPHKHCSGKLFVTLSALDPLATTLLEPKSWTISNFTSVADMAEISHGTGYLSCFVAPKPYGVVRNTPVIDGGYSSSFAELCPPNVKRCIKLAAFTVGPNNPTHKVPDCPVGFAAIPPTTSRPLAGAPNTLPQNDWTLPNTCQYEQQTKAIIAPQQPPFVAAENPDIFPGNPYNALKHDPCLWQSWAMNVTAITPESPKHSTIREPLMQPPG